MNQGSPLRDRVYFQAEATERAVMGGRVRDGTDLAPFISSLWHADPRLQFRSAAVRILTNRSLQNTALSSYDITGPSPDAGAVMYSISTR